jgi:uncharacterized protein YndB with AHSA1/START domain
MEKGNVMPDILHRVGIKERPKKVFEALSTIQGLRHWWVIDTTGDTKQGSIINFGFCEMKVVKSEPKKLVKWKCVRGPKDWVG